MALFDASPSPILKRFCSQLYDLNVGYWYHASQSRTYERRNVASEHRDILDAEVDRDIECASELLQVHYPLVSA